MFANYRLSSKVQQENIHFHIPNFQDPLMSPAFGKLNLIHEIDSQVPHRVGQEWLKTFYLGSFNSSPNQQHQNIKEFKTLPLKEAIRKKIYWELLQDGFPQNIDFLKKLIPFLASLEKPHFVIFLYKNSQAVAMLTIGVSQNIGLILNAVIKSQYQGQWLTRPLYHLIQKFGNQYKIDQFLYWTIHRALTKYFDKAHLYSLYQNKASKQRPPSRSVFTQRSLQ